MINWRTWDKTPQTDLRKLVLPRIQNETRNSHISWTSWKISPSAAIIQVIEFASYISVGFSIQLKRCLRLGSKYWKQVNTPLKWKLLISIRKLVTHSGYLKCRSAIISTIESECAATTVGIFSHYAVTIRKKIDTNVNISKFYKYSIPCTILR